MLTFEKEAGAKVIEPEQFVAQLIDGSSRRIRPEEVLKEWPVPNFSRECIETIARLRDGNWLCYTTEQDKSVTNCAVLSASQAIEWLLKNGCPPMVMAQVLGLDGPTARGRGESVEVSPLECQPHPIHEFSPAREGVPRGDKSHQTWGPEPFGVIMDDAITFPETKLRRLGPGKYMFLKFTAYTDFDQRRLIGTEAADLEQAVTWLIGHGYELPEDLYQYVTERHFKAREAEAAPTSPIHWDSKTCELTYKGEVAKRIASLKKASNVVKILSAFQEEGWPQRIDSPFTGDEQGRATLRESIRSLNDKLQFLEFRADGSGEGVRWRLSH